MSRASQRRDTARRAVVGLFALTAALAAAILVQILRSGTDPANTSAPGYLPLAYSATAVLVVVFVIAAFVRRLDIGLGRGFPWLVGGVSLVLSVVPWWALTAGNVDFATVVYRGLRVPQGPFAFWDMTLVMKSVDCAGWGFDVFTDNNGCLQDAAIYAPGMLWLQYVPFGVFSESNVAALGVATIVLSSLFLVWLARSATGAGQLVLLAAAAGAPWLLLLERGNIDAAVLWCAGVVVLLVRRWDWLWSWGVAAGLIWLVGTWKYYPFAMGLMLIPVLRLRRGWAVLLGFAVATSAFMILTWDNFRFSSQSNTNMIDYGDYVVLGRVPVVARMLGTVVGAPGLQLGDLLYFALALAAFAWGVAFAVALRRRHVHPAMLAVAGSSLFLASVLVAGFGWGYKAAFLLLCVPLVASTVGSPRRAIVASSVCVLLLIGIQGVVVWNTVLATTSGITAAAFALGAASALLVRSVLPALRGGRRATAAPATA